MEIWRWTNRAEMRLYNSTLSPLLISAMLFFLLWGHLVFLFLFSLSLSLFFLYHDSLIKAAKTLRLTLPPEAPGSSELS